MYRETIDISIYIETSTIHSGRERGKKIDS